MWANLLILIVASCAAVNPAEEQARRFMQAYYVEADLNAAAGLADGLALEKVNSSIALTRWTSGRERSDHPSVAFSLVEDRVSGDEAEYLFKVTLSPKGIPPILKSSRIKVRRRAGGWRVTQFADTDR